MRSFTLLLLLYCSVWSLSAQTFPMDGTSIMTCSGFFTDSGGNNGDYQANENYTTTICSDGSSGTHIKLIFSAPGIIEGDELCFYDGTDTSAPLLSCHTDFSPNSPFIVQATAANISGCLTVTFTSNASDEGPGWSSIIECIPACQTIIATLSSTTPIISPPDTGYIDICPGDRVYFDAMGQYPQDGLIYNHSDFTSGFSWNFGDGTVAVGPSTSHVFDEPGGYIVQVLIEDQFGCTSTNFISQRVRVSTYPDFELAGVPSEGLCAGDTISLNALVNVVDTTYNLSVQSTEGSFVQAGALSDTLLLPDGTGSSYQTSIGFTQFSPGAVLTDPEDILGVSLFMEHSYGGDLDIELICPNGQSAYMLDFPSGVGSTNFGEPWATGPIDGQSADLTPGTPYEYTFMETGAEYGTLPSVANNFNYTYTTVPSVVNGSSYTYSDNYFPEGSYLPMESFNNLVGCPLNGEWTIRVQDNLGLDNGWLFRWEIAFASDLYPVIETFRPDLIDWAWEQNSSIDFYSPDSISAILNNAGTTNFTFSVEDDFGCTYDTTVIVTALPPTHPDCFSCQTSISTIADTSICNGETATLTGSTGVPLNDQEVTFGASSGIEFDGSTFPPGNPIVSTIAVDYINPAVLTDPALQIESVCLNIEHNFDADVEIRLQAPNGAIIELSTDNGGSGDDYTNTCFSPTAVNPITTGAAPFTGSWIPEGDWNDLAGSPITGNWSLLVADDQNGFGGEFIDWTISFNSTNEVTYNWSADPTLSCTNCPDPVATPIETTDYILNAIDAYGCVITDTVTVTILGGFEAPVLSCGNADNGALTIDWLPIMGANSYEFSLDGGLTWNPTSGTLSHTIFGLSDGDVVNILVQVDTVIGSCPVIAGSIQCTYSDPCAFDLSIASTQDPTCWNSSDGSVSVSTANAQAPVNYSLDGNMNSANPDFFNVSAGSHVVYAQDGTGCIDSVVFSLTSPDSIELAFATIDASCFGDCSGEATVSANGGSGNITYNWTNASNSNGDNATTLCAGSYTVIATDANGCVNIDSAAVDQPDALEIIDINPTNVSCFGDNTGNIEVIVTGGTGTYNYQWNDPSNQTTGNAQNLLAGTYTLQVSDANGCTTIDSATITQPDSALMLTLTQTLIGCADASAGVAEVLANGGVGAYSYEWSNGATGSIADNLNDEEYFVTVTDANGCTQDGSIQVTELEPIISVLSSTDPICFEGSDGSIVVDTVFGGVGGDYTFNWNNGAFPPDSVLTNLSGGIEYQLIITDSQGCEGLTSISLNDPEEIIVVVETNLPSCNGFNDGSATVVNVQGGTPSYTYLWDNNAGNQTDVTAMTLSSGNYEVTVTDANGCTGTRQVLIDQPTTMQLSFNIDNVDCPGENGGSVTVNTIGGVPQYTFEWDNGGSTSTIDNVSSGSYSVTVTDANGCFIEETVSVESPDPLIGTLEVNDVTCFGDDDGLIRVNMSGGTPPYQYSLDGEALNNSSTMIRLLPGSYNIYVEDANGCSWSEDASVEEPEEFVVNAGPEMVEIILGDSIQLIPGQYNSAGFVNYTWFEPFPGALSCDPPDVDGCDRPYAVTLNTAIYEVYGIDANGCESTDEITVRVIKPRDIFVASGFTPNGDGANDLLMVHGPENVIVQQFRVFDRWGNKVFDYVAPDELDGEAAVLVNDPNFGWNGNFRDEPMGSGVYVWYVEVRYIDGFQKIYKGNTTLIR